MSLTYDTCVVLDPIRAVGDEEAEEQEVGIGR